MVPGKVVVPARLRDPPGGLCWRTTGAGRTGFVTRTTPNGGPVDLSSPKRTTPRDEQYRTDFRPGQCVLRTSANSPKVIHNRTWGLYTGPPRAY